MYIRVVRDCKIYDFAIKAGEYHHVEMEGERVWLVDLEGEPTGTLAKNDYEVLTTTWEAGYTKAKMILEDSGNLTPTMPFIFMDSFNRYGVTSGLPLDYIDGVRHAIEEFRSRIEWVAFTRRTDDPKLTWIENQLDTLSIPHRRRGESRHSPIMEVPAPCLVQANTLLSLPTGDGDFFTIDDLEDDHPFFTLED